VVSSEDIPEPNGFVEYDRVQKDRTIPRWTSAGIALVALGILLPLVLGGCPEFRNDVVNSIDTATRGILNAALDLLFNQFRNSSAG
jgi:hypothetical protein